jgi:hypothetical protein
MTINEVCTKSHCASNGITIILYFFTETLEIFLIYERTFGFILLCNKTVPYVWKEIQIQQKVTYSLEYDK